MFPHLISSTYFLFQTSKACLACIGINQTFMYGCCIVLTCRITLKQVTFVTVLQKSLNLSLSLQVASRQEVCFTSVPSQPVPPLVQTLQAYLRGLEPLLPPEELRHTRMIVQEFARRGGLGARLQEGLERRARHTNNWVCVCCVAVGNVTDVLVRHGESCWNVCGGETLPDPDLKQKSE